MKIARFRVNGKTHYGSVEGNRIVKMRGNPFGKITLTTDSYLLGDVKLLYPTQPRVLWASSAAMYKNHGEWVAREWPEIMAAQAKMPPKPPSPGPQVDFRNAGALQNPDDPIIVPKEATRIQWESEVVIVIGKKARKVSKEKAYDYILGYTLGNDVSERVWQWDDASFWRAKGSETFKPIGPWIDTEVKYRDLVVTTRLNEREVQTYKTADSVYDPADFVSFMSQYLTLYPGDMIYMGAEGAPTDMKVGDVVEIEANELGVLRNPLLAER